MSSEKVMTMSEATKYLMNAANSTNGATFASFVYTSKESGETVKYTAIIGADTAEAYRKDMATLDAMMPTLSGIELQAAQEIYSSLAVSLEGGIGNNPAYTNAGVYDRVAKSFEVHNATGKIYLTCRVIRRDVITAGVHKTVNSKPLTLAKKAIDKKLRRGQFRRMLLDQSQTISLGGVTVDFED